MLKVIIHNENLMPIDIYGLNYPEFISMMEKLQKKQCNICRNILMLGESMKQK